MVPVRETRGRRGGRERYVQVRQQGRDLGRLKDGRVDEERGPLSGHEVRVRLDEPFDVLAGQLARAKARAASLLDLHGCSGILPHSHVSTRAVNSVVRRLCEEHYPNSKFESTPFSAE